MMKSEISRFITGEIKLLGGLNERLFSLLAAIERTGSINQAAKEVGLTYKGAWDMIERANNLSPQLLVSSATGGKQGGGTQLTAAGKELLTLFLQIQKQHRQFLNNMNHNLLKNDKIVFLLKRLIMKASARNQFFGTVTAVEIGMVNAEISVALKGGETVDASITKHSVDSLGIKTGSEVLVLVKAPNIVLVTDFGGFKLSARNQLAGTVSRIQKGAVNSEVVIMLKGGDSIASTITNESLEALALTEGSSATAVFKAGAVILGVAA